MQTIMSMIIYLIANAVGLLIATFVLPDFQIDFVSFILVVIVFSVVLAILTPIIRKISERRAPAMLGGLSLIAIFACLFVTNLIMPGMEMGGWRNWIMATILVWIGSMIAMMVLPRFLQKAPKA